MQRSTRLIRPVISILALMLASGGTAVASLPAPTPTPEQRLAALLPRLGSDSLAERESASQALERDRDITLDMIEQALTDNASLSPEQLERIGQVGAELFSKQPHAALGVSFSWGERSPDGVEISGAIPGFDSQRVLQPGDIIQSLDGIRLTDQPQTRAVIVSHSPGDEVTLKVIRQGEPIVVKLKLGDYANLEATRGMRAGAINQGFAGQSSRLDSATLRAAWDLRRERAQNRVGRAAGQPIESGLTERQWTMIDIASGHREDDVAASRRLAAARRAQDFQGGARIQVRQGPPQIAPPLAQVQEGQPEAEPSGAVAVAAAGSDRIDVLSAPHGFALGSSDAGNADSRAELAEMLRNQDNLIAQQEAFVRAAGNLPPEVRAQLTNQLAQLKQERNQLKFRLQRQQQRMGGVQP